MQPHPIPPVDPAEEARKAEEIAFHDERERDRNVMSERDFLRKYPNKRFYAIAGGSRGYVSRWMQAKCPGKVALDYCCGLGETTVELAKHGAMAHGIDISPEEIRTAEKAARDAGVADRTAFAVMDAERMDFPDNTFDLIVCSGVLHHLDLNRAYPELARVLKPDGEIICIEALAHNPVIRAYRRRTPHLRTAWEVDHILGIGDIKRGKRFFEKVDVRFFHLATIVAIPLQDSVVFRPLLRLLELVDRVLLAIPGLQLMAWQTIFTLSRPRKA